MIGLLSCPFCGSGDIEIHGMPAVMEAPDTAQCADCNACAEAVNWNTRVAFKAGQGEAVYQVEWIGEGGGGYCDTEKDDYEIKRLMPKYRTRIVYTAPPATGVIVPRELLERATCLNQFINLDALQELRALLAQSQDVKS